MTSVNGIGQEAEKSRQFAETVVISQRPILRVGLGEGYPKVDFHLYGSFTIADLSGRKVFTSIESDLRWRTTVEKAYPAEFHYYVHLETFADRKNADQSAKALRKEGYPAKVMEVGKRLELLNDLIVDSRKYRVVVGDYGSEEECSPLIKEFFDRYNPKVVQELVESSTGEIEVFDAEYDLSARIAEGFRIIPEQPECRIKIHNVKIGEGFHWEKAVDRIYEGIMEIRLDHEGKLWIINEIPIDKYLKGVVPSEMPANYPLEALKAQTVAARSNVLSQLFFKHINEPFDVCATVHCQVYSGVGDNHPNSNLAVTETAGEVIAFDNIVCDAVYSSVCGGHTENRENIWTLPEKEYLKGIYDSSAANPAFIDLSEEQKVIAWIKSNPQVFCNVEACETPSSLQGAIKYFRWEESYTRKQLEEIIYQKIGINVGSICSIEPRRRGVSGRITEIEILGSLANHRIKGELDIRRALSKTTLKSSCFYIEMTYDRDGMPAEITFHGAGWGHGVGMCQVGAAVMASQGMDYREILKHYYRGVEIEKAYDIIIKKSNDSKQLQEQKVTEE